MTGKRAKYSGDFKVKVALEAIKGEMTLRNWRPSTASTRR